MRSASHRSWQKQAVIYQVWPNSFNDATGDGVGDLQGITQRLDHLDDLGVDVVWLSPIYASPQRDMGYDISDYRAIHPLYGTMHDLDHLLQQLHNRAIQIMHSMDLVVNHTSSEHPWFLESRSSKSNPKRDWYFWRPAKYDAQGQRQPPNNWKAVFGAESAWTWDETTQWPVTESQPDLNWDNPQVRGAVFDLMHFWLKKGVDGFRMDVINLISKAEGLPDASITDPSSKYQEFAEHCADGPHVHEYLQEMNQKVLSHYDVITVGETPYNYDVNKLVRYSLPSSHELQMVFTFELHSLDGADLNPQTWTLPEFKRIVAKYQKGIVEAGGWTSVYLENHDQARSIPRWASRKPEFRTIGAKMLALFHVACTGSLYVYQGEEIGMSNLPADWSIEEYKDVATQTWWSDHLKQRREKTGQENPDMSDVMDAIRFKARDHARSPVQWNDSPHAGFTTGEPWMRVNDDYREWNLKAQLADRDSVYHFWKQAIAFRKAHPACTYGQFDLLAPAHEQVFAFTKSIDEERLLVLCNFSEENVVFRVPADCQKLGPACFTNVEATLTGVKDGLISLAPFQAHIHVL